MQDRDTIEKVQRRMEIRILDPLAIFDQREQVGEIPQIECRRGGDRRGDPGEINGRSDATGDRPVG